jgi:hypothetical protein
MSMRFRWVLLVALSSFALSASAQSERADLVHRIAVAQGIHSMFDTALAQQRAAAAEFTSALTARRRDGAPIGPQEQKAIDQFIAGTGNLFTGEELAAFWTSNYGGSLSIPELQEILKYHESTIGRKDGLANGAIMATFGAWMAQESKVRMERLLQEFNRAVEAARR